MSLKSIIKNRIPDRVEPDEFKRALTSLHYWITYMLNEEEYNELELDGKEQEQFGLSKEHYSHIFGDIKDICRLEFSNRVYDILTTKYTLMDFDEVMILAAKITNNYKTETVEFTIPGFKDGSPCATNSLLHHFNPIAKFELDGIKAINTAKKGMITHGHFSTLNSDKYIFSYFNIDDLNNFANNLLN